MNIIQYEFHEEWIVPCINSLWDNKPYDQIVAIGDGAAYDLLQRLYTNGSLAEYIKYMMNGRINNFKAKNSGWIRDYNILFPKNHNFDERYMRTVGMVWEQYEDLVNCETVMFE